VPIKTNVVFMKILAKEGTGFLIKFLKLIPAKINSDEKHII
jgi:hypothetical protein